MDLKKYHVTIDFELSDEFMSLVPAHRSYINKLINKEIIDHYAVSMEAKRIWITISAIDKESVDEFIGKSPLFEYFKYYVNELAVLDGITYRLPQVQLN
ncbi:MAG: hypothetical protein H7Y27_05555 [Gemmatimonadaceae bacterium]|nr:hypothetical protein [Chitinophagaceae bacterium]